MVDVAPREKVTRAQRAGSVDSDRIDAEVDAQLARSSSDVSVDVASLGEQLLGTWADIRRGARELVKDPALHNIPGLVLSEQRARARGQLQLLVDRGAVHRAFPKYLGGDEDNGGNITGFEELVAADPSLQIKSGVQWGLFASAVLQLGTEYHHRTVPARHHEPEGAGRFRDDRDRARVGCRVHRHDGDLRRRGRRSSSSTPRSARRGRTTSATRARTARPRPFSRSSSPTA